MTARILALCNQKGGVGKSTTLFQLARAAVLAGRRAGGRIEILNGLSGDERVAGTNAFLLKAELAKGEAEHGH